MRACRRLAYADVMSTQPVGAIHPDEITWGDRLRRLRLNRDMDQRQFAAMLDVRPATIGNYEVSGHKPRTAALVENSVELRFGPDAARFLRDPQPTGCRPRHLVLVPQLSEVA